jgi:two-component system response regulator FlrC
MEVGGEYVNTQPSILIVDDEVILREILSEALADAGWQIFEASGGFEALEILAKQSIDLVLSDINMPDGSGFDLLAATQAKNPKIPVVCLVSGFSHFSQTEILAKGAAAFFQKPYDFSLIIKTLRSILDQQVPDAADQVPGRKTR